MRISDWSSDVCSSDLGGLERLREPEAGGDRLAGAAPLFAVRPGNLRLWRPGGAADPRRGRTLRRAARVSRRGRLPDLRGKIGRASWRERVWKYVSISVAAGHFKTKQDTMASQTSSDVVEPNASHRAS